MVLIRCLFVASEGGDSGTIRANSIDEEPPPLPPKVSSWTFRSDEPDYELSLPLTMRFPALDHELSLTQTMSFP